MAQLQVIFLGTGTSMGIPTLGCPCDVCHSDDARDRRTRPSLLLRYDGHNVVIDTSPDFRVQMLREGVEQVDAVVYTHAHADHVLGLDDLRAYNLRQGQIPLYASPETRAGILKTFHYVFGGATPNSTIPRLQMNDIGGRFELFGLEFAPLQVFHGEMEVLGFRFGPVAYVTDFSVIPKMSLERLEDLELLVLSALRDTPHPNHSTVENSVELARKLKPRRTCFTHMAHDLPHAATNERLPEGVELAYDGLKITVEF